MGIRRVDLMGFRDYRCVSLQDIIDDLRTDFLDETARDLNSLQELKKVVVDRSEELDNTEEILDFLGFFISLFSDFVTELGRVHNELTRKVQDKHIQILMEIFNTSKETRESMAKQFAHEFLWRDLKNESLRPLLDEIDSLVDNRLYSNISFKSISERLQTFIGDAAKYDKLKKSATVTKTGYYLEEIPPETNWQDVTLGIIDPFQISIVVGGKSYGARGFHSLGFIDRRTKDPTPDNNWILLLRFIASEGKLSWKDGINFYKTRTLFKKRVQTLRPKLRELFSIDTNPIIYLSKAKLYRIKFMINLYVSRLGDRINDSPEFEGHLEDIQNKIRKSSGRVEAEWAKESRGKKNSDN